MDALLRRNPTIEYVQSITPQPPLPAAAVVKPHKRASRSKPAKKAKAAAEQESVPKKTEAVEVVAKPAPVAREEKAVKMHSSTSSSKRRRGEKAGKPKKTHSRSKSKSRRREISSDSESDSTVASSNDSDSDSSDSEVERQRRKRGRSRSRSRPREKVKKRGRSKSRARYSESEDSDSDDDNNNNNKDIDGGDQPIFMAFTQPSGQASMRCIKVGTPFPKLMETVYAACNISQAISLELTYVMLDITLSLRDADDYDALLKAASVNGDKMIQIFVKKVEAAKPVEPEIVSKAQASKPAPPPTTSKDATTSVKAEKKIARKAKKNAHPAATMEKTAASVGAASADQSTSSSADVPLAGKPAAKDSVISIESSGDVPMARILIKGDGGDDTVVDDAVKSDEKEKGETKANQGDQSINGKVPEKRKRKRRTPLEMQEAKELEAKTKAEKAEGKEAAKPDSKAGEETAAKTQPKEVLSTPLKKADVEKKVNGDVAKKGSEAEQQDGSVQEKAALPATPKSAAKEKKAEKKADIKAVEEQVDLSVKKADSEAKKATDPSTPGDTTQATEQNSSTSSDTSSKKMRKPKVPPCTICLTTEHDKLKCPIIEEGKVAVEGRLAELKAKKHKKTKPENEACRILETWLKTSAAADREEAASIRLQKTNGA
ncbi:hypothetical protein CBS101457_005752 [Exobasidium rhododendri]|nr:hypothetical protein CBS101457_005752 [Exobasidium rhododendri]